MSEFTEVVEITLEQKIETDLVKANVTDAVIGSLKAKYGTLRLKSVDDKGTYLEIKDGAKECAKWRNIPTIINRIINGCVCHRAQ